jgi:hypothetical protein
MVTQFHFWTFPFFPLRSRGRRAVSTWWWQAADVRQFSFHSRFYLNKSFRHLQIIVRYTMGFSGENRWRTEQ